MPWRSTPPDLALGSGALSLNAEPSNFSGTGAAMAKEGDNPSAPAATATLVFRNSRRLHDGQTVYGPVMTFLPLALFSSADTAVKLPCSQTKYDRPRRR